MSGPSPEQLNQQKAREVDERGNCSKCGGTHYGTGWFCPMQTEPGDDACAKPVTAGAGAESAPKGRGLVTEAPLPSKEVTVRDGVAWVVRPDGDEWTATPGECAAEIARLRCELDKWQAPSNLAAWNELLDIGEPAHGNKALQVAAAVALLKADRDRWQERHDRERAAHAKNLTEQQKVEAERNRLRTAMRETLDELQLDDSRHDLQAKIISALSGEPTPERRSDETADDSGAELVAMLLPYLQQWQCADAAELEAKALLTERTERYLAGFAPKASGEPT